MCGITGIFAFNEIGRVYAINLQKSMETLGKRGPDQRGTLLLDRLSLGHSRLSIIDTSVKGKQPMSDESKRYHLIFNGEIFNFGELKSELVRKGYVFRSETDTEVLLYTLMEYGKEGLSRLNGFFAFAFFDAETKVLLTARDRFGIKPFYYYVDEDKYVFGSELKTVLAYNLPRENINHQALLAYLQFNYIPAPFTIYDGIYKLLPGQWMEVAHNREVKKGFYYKIPLSHENSFEGSYGEAKKAIRDKLRKSVERRLVSDVPLGSFLSGGIDSSIITGLAKELKPDLKTFTVGFPDYPYFDESRYSETVARHFGTDHQVIQIRENELLNTLQSSVDYFSEPFADSSAIAYHALCAKAGSELKVALSGDGADELFGGYMKHQAWQMIQQGNWKVVLAKMMLPFSGMLPQSRKNSIGNLNRRLVKLARQSKLSPKERYFGMCKISSQTEALSLLNAEVIGEISLNTNEWIASETGLRNSPENLNQCLFNDMKLVLSNDMLMKADHGSMANSLEVRVPFLDHELVNYVFSLPSEWKANSARRKQILVDAFEDFLPKAILNRPKHGFEVPLQKWLKYDLREEVDKYVFNRERVNDMRLLNWKSVEALRNQLHSGNPGDSPARIWALYHLMKKLEGN